MNAGKVWCGISLLALLCGLATPARAESEAQKKQAAKEHYQVATRFYDLGKYGEAVQEYEAAYLLVADPNLLFNIGQAYRLWDKPEEAVRSYKNYLRHKPDAPNRADVERRIAELERTGDTQGPTEPPPNTPAMASASSSGVTPPIPPAAAEGPTTSPLAITAQAKPADKPAGPSWLDRHSQAGAYVMFSAGGACLLTSMVTGIIASSKAKQLADDSKKTDASNRPIHPVFDPSVQSTGKTLNTVAILTGVTGLAMGGAGLYLHFRARRVSDKARAADLDHSLAVFPWAGPGLAGAGARVTY